MAPGQSALAATWTPSCRTSPIHCLKRLRLCGSPQLGSQRLSAPPPGGAQPVPAAADQQRQGELLDGPGACPSPIISFCAN